MTPVVALIPVALSKNKIPKEERAIAECQDGQVLGHEGSAERPV